MFVMSTLMSQDFMPFLSHRDKISEELEYLLHDSVGIKGTDPLKAKVLIVKILQLPSDLL